MAAPVVITGTLEAEQFDMGGPGVGYYSLGGNPTNSYRPTGLFITNCDDIGAGYCLDQTRAGEWAVYTINVLVPQDYNIEARVEGIGTNGVFECEFSNNSLYTNTGPLTITSTNWTNVAAPVYLTNGIYAMKLRFLTNGIDGAHVGKFNYISIYPWWQAGFTSTYTNICHRGHAEHEQRLARRRSQRRRDSTGHQHTSGHGRNSVAAARRLLLEPGLAE